MNQKYVNKDYMQRLRAEVTPKSLNKSSDALKLLQQNSFWHVLTAGASDVGRFQPIQFLHASEVAFWDNASAHLTALFTTVPNGHGSHIIIESTANGKSGAFYDLCKAAQQQNVQIEEQKQITKQVQKIEDIENDRGKRVEAAEKRTKAGRQGVAFSGSPEDFTNQFSQDNALNQQSKDLQNQMQINQYDYQKKSYDKKLNKYGFAGNVANQLLNFAGNLAQRVHKPKKKAKRPFCYA